MRALALSGLLLAGCFDPHPPAGRPCGDREPRCPSGLVCSPATETCEEQAQPVIDAAPDETPPDATPPCFTDNFNDGTASDWMTAEGGWAIAPTGGPDGSPAYRAMTAGAATVTHPLLFAVKTAKIAADFRMEGAVSGDFFVRFFQPGWIADPPNGKRYTAAIYVMGGDDPNDAIFVTNPPSAPVQLAKRATTIPAATWHHIDVTYRAGNAIYIELDGQPYLDIASDPTLAAPFDVAFRFWQPGALDNVVVDCTR